MSCRCKSCLGRCRDTSVATKTVRRVTDWSKLLGQRPTMGGSASRRAATCVKPEQASNVTSRGLNGLNNREGRWGPCEHPTDDHGFARRGKGRGTSAQHTGQHGRSHAARRAPRSIIRVEPRGKSEGLIVPSAPGGPHNRRGGKEPWFATCLNESRSRSLARACELLAGAGDSKRGAGPHGRAGAGGAGACQGAPLVREPDAGTPHVRFDERTWETPDRCGWRSMRASKPS